MGKGIELQVREGLRAAKGVELEVGKVGKGKGWGHWGWGKGE